MEKEGTTQFRVVQTLVSQRATRAVLITGTPATTKPLTAFVQVDTLTHGRLLGYVPASAKGAWGYRAETSTDPKKWKARAGNFKRDACHGGHIIRKMYSTAYGGQKMCVEKKAASWTGNSHPHELNAVITVSQICT